MNDSDQSVSEEEVIVTLGVFSGLPNPAFNLAIDEAEKLAEMVNGVVGKEAIHPPPPPRLGKFYGFYLKVPAALAKRLELPDKMRIVSGVLTAEKDHEQKHWRDSERIGEYLTVYAFKKGFGKFLKPLGIEGPSMESTVK